MISLLKRMFIYKVLLAAMVFSIAGYGCWFLDRTFPVDKRSGLLSWIPTTSLSGAFFEVALVALVFELFARLEAEQHLVLRLKEGIAGGVQNIIEMLRPLLTEDPLILNRLVPPEARDRVIQALLSSKFGSQQVATELFDATFRKLIKATTIYYNYRCVTSLFEGDTVAGKDYYTCVITVNFETDLTQRGIEFCCSSSELLADTISKDKDVEFTWLHASSTTDLEEFEKHAGFELERFQLNGRSIRITKVKSSGPDGHRLSFSPDQDALADSWNSRVAIEFQIRTRVRRSGGLMTLYYGYPTKHLTYELAVSDPALKSIDIREFFSVSGKVTKDIGRAGPSGFRAHVHVHDWAFPRGGVVLTWKH